MKTRGGEERQAYVGVVDVYGLEKSAAGRKLYHTRGSNVKKMNIYLLPTRALSLIALNCL
jgi:hypothetical protein